MPNLKRVIVPQIKPPSEKVPVIVLPRDRPYDEDEQYAFKSALMYETNLNPIIKPTPGTLVYYFRNIDNEEVLDTLRASMRRKGFAQRHENADELRVLLLKLIEYYRKLDEGSRKRPDVFDYLCITLTIDPLDVWEVYKKEAEVHAKEMTKHDIEVLTPHVVKAIAKKALKDNDIDGKKLFARIAGLDTDSPAIVFQDNSVNNTQVNNNQNIFTNFSASIKRSEVELDNANEPKQLSEGEQNYIDAEYSDIENREKVA